MGHRGAPLKAPENTLKSFEYAIDIGVDLAELDVMQTADGYIVCMHHWDVSRTTNGEGMVEELTLREIKALDAGSGQQVPMLSEVLDLVRGKIGINVDIKVPDIEKQVLDLILEKKMLESSIVSSFIHSSLSAIKDLNPAIFTGLLIEHEVEDFIDYVQQFSADAFHPNQSILTKEMVEGCHAAGLKVHVWTVNDESDMTMFLDWGVDGIITDMPVVCVRVVDSMFP